MPVGQVLRHLHGRQLGQAVSLFREEHQAQLLETVLQELSALGMAGPCRLDALVEHGAQSGVQRRDHGHRRGVVVDPATLPSLHVAREQS